MKKIGLLCLAMVIALGGLGIGYAAWTDTVTITGTVNTGSVDIVVENWSNTWVWKVLDNLDYPGEIAELHQWETDPNNDQAPPGAITSNLHPDGTLHYELAFADSDFAGDDVVQIRYANLFPSIDFTADFLLHYTGTIPVKVDLVNVTTDNPLLAQYMQVKFYEATIDPTSGLPVQGAEILPLLGVQLHNSNRIIVAITIHLPQDSGLMLQSGTITGTISVIQWNEAP